MGKLAAEGFETDRWHGRRSIGAGCGVKRGGDKRRLGVLYCLLLLLMAVVLSSSSVLLFTFEAAFALGGDGALLLSEL